MEIWTARFAHGNEILINADFSKYRRGRAETYTASYKFQSTDLTDLNVASYGSRGEYLNLNATSD